MCHFLIRGEVRVACLLGRGLAGAAAMLYRKANGGSMSGAPNMVNEEWSVENLRRLGFEDEDWLDAFCATVDAYALDLWRDEIMGVKNGANGANVVADRGRQV